ncbi:hypothetical protein [Ewingella americana]|uniref:Uncharacterized protein n=1 Tax=Ewingella americana TaxID=41202 RepID=A0A502GEY6_9GAMM|nr:hypothetical protein [Ewingella americana]TPG60098.1 hypothetical protein EAH77_16145 [Ewingella americana]
MKKPFDFVHPIQIDTVKVSQKLYGKIRIRDIVGGIVPTIEQTEPEPYPNYVDINRYSLASIMSEPDGRKAHLLHLWMGNEGEIPLVEAVLPPETIWFYKTEMERIKNSVLGGNHMKRDTMLIDAIRKSIPQRIDSQNSDEDVDIPKE